MENQQDNSPQVIACESECIIREDDGRLVFIGEAADPRREAVERCNAGHHYPADLAALDDLPVFDKWQAGQPVVQVFAKPSI